jgi:hypothetical protein
MSAVEVIEIDDAAVSADEAFLDGVGTDGLLGDETALPVSAAVSPKPPGSQTDAALEKVLSAAQRLSDFYASPDATGTSEGFRVPSMFAGELYG